jgi:4-methylaminobutanoate oxidase (formaldehyde-forming)
LHEIYIARGARMQARGAWQIPADFGSIDTELEAARTAVAIGEPCGAAVLEIEGTEMVDLAARLGVETVPVGTAALVTLLDVRETRWCRLTQARARVLLGPNSIHRGGGSAASGELLAALSSPTDASSGCLHVTDVSSGLTSLVILGPRSPDLLARLVRLDVDPRVFADRAVALTGAIGVPLQLLRWDHGSLLAYELMVGRDVAEYFGDALTHAGENLGLKPIGAEALLRLLAELSA